MCNYNSLIVPVLYIRDSQLALLSYDYISNTSTSIITSVGTSHYTYFVRIGSTHSGCMAVSMRLWRHGLILIIPLYV